MERYARQMAFHRIGKEGQEKLLKSKVVIIGMGALGTVAANNLCRAGIGYIRMIDRDYVELTNLQRQVLYDEEDARKSLPKAVAAFNHLSKVNSEITLEPIVVDVNASNIEQLISDADIVLDANDNWEIRFLINEACHEYKIPWIYCGVIGSEGMTLNILPGKDGPCLKCFMNGAGSNQSHTCSTFGVMNMIVSIMASVQTAEAVKILLGSDNVRKELFMFDIWENETNYLKIHKNPDCPICAHKQFKYLGKATGFYTTTLCGSNSIQVVPAEPRRVEFKILAEKLIKAGNVRFDEYTLSFTNGKIEIMLFKDGRAMIKNAIDENNAKSIYAEYIGL